MKGGKGGKGRPHSAKPAVKKPAKKAPPSSGGGKGDPKRDWGAMTNDDEPPKPPTHK